MSKILEDLKDIIINSNLSPADQNDLLIFLPVLPEKVLEDLKVIFSKSPKMLSSFNEDFKARLEALIDGRDAYQKMVEKENENFETWKEEFGEKEEEEAPWIAEESPQEENKDDEE
jgi:hypothetical protein